MSATIILKGTTMNNPRASQLPAGAPPQPVVVVPTFLPQPSIGTTARTASDGSAASAKYDEGDEYDDYDDFSPANCRVGSGRGGGAAGQSGKQKRRENNRGGSGGSGTIYSAKHIRTRETLRDRKGKK